MLYFDIVSVDEETHIDSFSFDQEVVVSQWPAKTCAAWYFDSAPSRILRWKLLDTVPRNVELVRRTAPFPANLQEKSSLLIRCVSLLVLKLQKFIVISLRSNVFFRDHCSRSCNSVSFFLQVLM